MADHPWRKDLFMAAVVVFLLATGLRVAGEAENIEALHEGCERQNVRTQLQYEKYLADEEESRAFSAEQPPGTVKQITLEAANQYRDSARALVQVVQDDGVQLEDGSPQSNCDTAYQPPFPLNLFD